MTDWSRDGTTLVFSSRGESNWDLWAMRVTGDRKPFPLRKTKFSELNGTLSPDGRFLAFQSNESGQPEVYVQEFPEARSKWQISPSGGREPLVAGGRARALLPLPRRPPDGRADREGRAFASGTPQPLFQARFSLDRLPQPVPAEPDGQRFLILPPWAGTPCSPRRWC